MSAQIDSHDLTADPSKDTPSDRGRDTRKGAHNDGGTEEANNPANTYDGPTHGAAAVLRWMHPDTPLDDRGVIERKAAYFEGADDPRPDPCGEWEGESHPRDGQATLTGWSQ